MKIIARIENDYTSKFGIPRQSGLVDEVISKVIFEKEYRNPDSLRGIDGYSHLWLLWGFSENKKTDWSPTVRPPRLGGNKRMGVFATRSPFRPNPIGLSSVKLERVEKDGKNGDVLIVSGADLLRGTPIYDIKPYIAFTDSHPDAHCGFSEDVAGNSLTVETDGAFSELIPGKYQMAVKKILENDPRPAYQDSADRVYGFEFAGMDIRFTAESGRVRVISVDKRNI